MSSYKEGVGWSPEDFEARGHIQWVPAQMTLRDYFAGQAIAGHMASHANEAINQSLAANAYAMADAMLAERVKS